MCLPIEVRRPDLVVAKGENFGHQWRVTQPLDHYCGYVRLEKGHPWHGITIDDDLDIAVNGGITFAEPDLPCNKGGADDAWWIGFDYAHYWNFEQTQKYNFIAINKECLLLCRQAAAAAIGKYDREFWQLKYAQLSLSVLFEHC